MASRDRVHQLVDELAEEDLRVVERMLRGLKVPEPTASAPVSEEERLARIDAVCGKYADSLSSVDQFLARKRADKVREDERDRRRQAGVP